MCLESISKKTGKWNKGWKVFCTNDRGDLKPDCQDHATETRVTYDVNKWFKDTAPGKIQVDNGCGFFEYYPKGFHYFKSKKAAKEWAAHFQEVFEVKVRNIVATGKQNCSIVGVAKEIFIVQKKD